MKAAILTRTRTRLLRLAVATLVAVQAMLPLGIGAAQAPSRIDRERARSMLEQARKDIQKYYYDPAYRGVDVVAHFAAANDRIEKAATIDEMMGAIAQVTLEFNDSHTLFIPPLRTVRVDYGWDMLIVGDSCYVSKVQPKSDAAAQGLLVGDVILTVNGYRPTRRNVSQLDYVFKLLRPQPGLRVVVQTPGGSPRQLDIASKVRQTKRVLDLTGADGGSDIWSIIREWENEAEGFRPRYVEVGEKALIWKMPEFSGDLASIKELKKRARKREAMILDLRGNAGGVVETLQSLLGFFFEREIIVATMKQKNTDSPLIARGAGNDRFAGRLIVLIDSESASASELFARTIQLSQRGTVIGDRSAGAVMVSRGYHHQIGAEMVVFYGTNVTVSDVVMPDGGRLEGVGVIPDEIILPTAGDLSKKRDPVLSRALALVGVEISPDEAGSMLSGR